MSYDFDVIVLGGGPGGYTAAIRASRLGLKTAVIEADSLGGTCLNRGCIPTKAILASAHTYHEMKKAHEFGIDSEKISFNLEKIMKRKDDIVVKLRDGIAQLFKANKITLINGFGRLDSSRGVVCADKTYTYKKLILATGSRPLNLPFLPPNSQYMINSDQALKLNKLPKKLLVIGGGVIGAEMANFFAFLGVNVTIVELMPQLLPNEDASLAKRLASIFKKYAITVKTGKKVLEIKEDRQAGCVNVKLEGESEQSSFDMVLQAVGRSRVINDIGLENASVKTDGKKIIVNEYFQTSNPDIFAVGDCSSDIMLAHLASHQGVTAAYNASCEGASAMRKLHAVVPSCIYTIPEVASCGMTPDKAKKSGMELVSGKFMFSMLGRAL
ncbi:MAG TPA: dihydrolipoyl dehydrogenase, partial [Candidatus Wallbacteria bacterium]|nr:dihydrolipoyl dehydrogenase [Candidatus Wallbacteria bacterium]